MVQIAEAISSNKVAVALSNEQRCCSFEYQVAVALSTDQRCSSFVYNVTAHRS